ncbi:unnamed protein product [Gongylonema pulchrum]|uniref:Suppressor protein SRP40-like n=1 Tax=Gongylonema pulchrum TaxID=637853 RepID=A0A183DKF4_9BILA|nr:unnamed protein product [Gongylonema pulchrum]
MKLLCSFDELFSFRKSGGRSVVAFDVPPSHRISDSDSTTSEAVSDEQEHSTSSGTVTSDSSDDNNVRESVWSDEDSAVTDSEDGDSEKDSEFGSSRPKMVTDFLRFNSSFPQHTKINSSRNFEKY